MHGEVTNHGCIPEINCIVNCIHSVFIPLQENPFDTFVVYKLANSALSNYANSKQLSELNQGKPGNQGLATTCTRVRHHTIVPRLRSKRH